MIKNNKKLVVIMAVIILTLSLTSTGFAANTMATLKAYYRNVTIYKNGTQANFTHEPFIVDGTTYVPVRDMSELLGKTVTFNPTTYRIDIVDTPDASTVALQTKMIQQEIKIKEYEDKIKDLESQLAKKEEAKVSNISDLEKALNKAYGTFEKVDFDIELSESKTKKSITVEAYVDLYYDYSAWKKIDKDEIEDYLQDIVDDIRKSYKDYTVTGFIYDEENDVKLYTFTLNNRGQVVLSTKSSTTTSSLLSNLEDDLDDFFYGDYAITDFEVSGTKSDIDVIVYVDYDEWTNLSSTKKKSAANKIIEFIEYDFSSAAIYGEFITDDKYEDFLGEFSN